MHRLVSMNLEPRTRPTVDGSISSVRGPPTEIATYHGAAAGLRDVWLAVRNAIGGVLDPTTLAELVVARSVPAGTHPTTAQNI